MRSKGERKGRGLVEDVFIGLGSNIQDPRARLQEALSLLICLQGIELVRVSSIYRSEPVGLEEQPWFLNAVAWLRSGLGAKELLDLLQEIENRMGRVRSVLMGPRIIDLDLLLVGQSIIQDEGLEVPHPRMHLRRFVLEPLVEICPWVRHPVFWKTVRELLSELKDSKEVELLEAWEVPGC